jgi:hypothetical protein
MGSPGVPILELESQGEEGVFINLILIREGWFARSQDRSVK